MKVSGKVCLNGGIMTVVYYLIWVPACFGVVFLEAFISTCSRAESHVVHPGCVHIAGAKPPGGLP